MGDLYIDVERRIVYRPPWTGEELVYPALDQHGRYGLRMHARGMEPIGTFSPDLTADAVREISRTINQEIRERKHDRKRPE